MSAELHTNGITKLYVVVNEDEMRKDVTVGVYSTPSQAAEAMLRVPFSRVEERELDKLPDEPEPRGEPDFNAPSSQERLERDSFDADRGGAR